MKFLCTVDCIFLNIEVRMFVKRTNYINNYPDFLIHLIWKKKTNLIPFWYIFSQWYKKKYKYCLTTSCHPRKGFGYWMYDNKTNWIIIKHSKKDSVYCLRFLYHYGNVQMGISLTLFQLYLGVSDEITIC